jgi:hypothetical protein
MAFNSSDLLLLKSKKFNNANKILLQNLATIIGYESKDNQNSSAQNIDIDKLQEGINYLKFINKDLTTKLDDIENYKKLKLKNENKQKLSNNNRMLYNVKMISLNEVKNSIHDEKYFEDVLELSNDILKTLEEAKTNYYKLNKPNKSRKTKKNTTNTSGNASATPYRPVAPAATQYRPVAAAASATQYRPVAAAASRPSRPAAANYNLNTSLKKELDEITNNIDDFINKFITTYKIPSNLFEKQKSNSKKENLNIVDYKSGITKLIPVCKYNVKGDGACGTRALLTGLLYIMTNYSYILPSNEDGELPNFIRELKEIMLSFISFLYKIEDNKNIINIICNVGVKNSLDIKTLEKYKDKLLNHWYYLTTDEMLVLCALFNLATPLIYQINIFSFEHKTVDSKTQSRIIEFPTKKHINLLHYRNHYDFIVDFNLPYELKNDKFNLINPLILEKK